MGMFFFRDGTHQETSHGNKLRDKSICMYWKIFAKILSPEQNFFIASSCTESVRLNLCNILRQQNSVAETNVFAKILKCTQSDLLLWLGAKLVAQPVHKGWFFTMICCSDMSHCVFWPLGFVKVNFLLVPISKKEKLGIRKLKHQDSNSRASKFWIIVCCSTTF